MQKLIAILKDSFRESVDGWVIYVMLALTTLLLVLVASMSVEPMPAQQAFDHMVNHFVIVNSDHGESVAARPFFFLVSAKELAKLNDAKLPQQGDYRFVLEINDTNYDTKASGRGRNRPQDEDGEKNKAANGPAVAGNEPKRSQFLQAVAYWTKVATHDELLMMKDPDTSGVTDEQMVEFIRGQFLTYGNMDVTKLTKRPGGSNGVYQFDVETKGIKGAKGWLHEPRLFFGAWKPSIPQSLGMWIYLVEGSLISDVGATIALMVGVIITAFFIPNLMRKGTVDLLLAKPIHRTTLLLFKYLGGLTFVFLNTAFAVGGIWLVIGLRTGVWNTGILFVILAITFYFAILYAVSTFAAVLTRSAIVAILATVAFWGLMFVVGFAQNRLQPLREDKTIGENIPKTLIDTVDVMNTSLPRTNDLDNLMMKLIVDDTLGRAEQRQLKKERLKYPAWGEVLGVSCGYIFVLLGLSCIRFVYRDY